MGSGESKPKRPLPFHVQSFGLAALSLLTRMNDGDVTKKPEYDTTASVKARKWKSFRTTLSGPQHLPIAKNEEAKRHDRGTLSQNEAFVACPALRANNAFTPLRSVRSAKNYNSPASSSAVETFHEETP